MKNKILFVYPNQSSFVKKDIELLSDKYDVVGYEFSVKQKWFTPFAFLKQFWFLLFIIGSFDLIVCQIAAFHSVLPVWFAKRFKKSSVIFLAGTDCAHFPSIHYGNFHKKLLGAATAWSVKNATHLAPKHPSLIYFKYDYDDKDFAAQGLQCFVKNFNTPYTIIANGYNARAFAFTGSKKKNSFITVAAGIGSSNINPLKGIDLIIQVAPLFPHCTFTLAGVVQNFTINEPNIICLPPQPNAALATLYSQHEFYLQLSMSEGFPNAICEAMLCQCIPIGSIVNAIPDIIGSTGFILKKRNAQQLAQLINTALLCNKNEQSKLARQQIEQNFSNAKRQAALQSLFDKLID